MTMKRLYGWYFLITGLIIGVLFLIWSGISTITDVSAKHQVKEITEMLSPYDDRNFLKTINIAVIEIPSLKANEWASSKKACIE